MGNLNKTKCQEEQRSVEKEREASKVPRDSLLANPSRKLSWESLSQLSEDSQEEEVSRESPASSMRRPDPCLDLSSRMSSETQSPTLNTTRGRLSLPSMLSTLSRDKEE